MTIGYFLALFIGISLGLLGGGGSILTVPILVYVLEMPAKSSIALSLVIVGVTALISALGHARKKNVNFKIAFIFAPMAMLGAFLGARLSKLMDGSTQLILFAIIMLLAAIFMFKGQKTNEKEDENETKEIKKTLILIQAFIVGIITGIVGVGGGFLIVPALVLLTGVSMKVAVGTSLLIIAFNSFSGFVGYIGTIEIPWMFLSIFTTVTVIGSLIGGHLSSYISSAKLKKVFAVFLIIMGFFILYKNKDKLVSEFNPRKADVQKVLAWDKHSYQERISFYSLPQDRNTNL
ncbi:sulfite exporter TauE/SafE [Bacteriovorax sp. BSW11_IV]|uniref:sulfite exporter TauE/SafE family protein n=1 Tax=Bacteriovorax sp. BSW11_IV TaxID=1353529 RepID=UPI00038A1131|nr:sulfite exporter TauE/SafE family protein [Bacteriovorax sp. BSW11_IV]EQC47807.1 sulfite exporter TauE/SafE [Bacteriovorax sp. BSW11_IV]